MVMGGLDREIKAFESMKAELEAAHADKFALINGDDLIDTFDNAAAEGLRRFPETDFLIRQIGAPPPKLSASILYGLTRADSSTAF